MFVLNKKLNKAIKDIITIKFYFSDNFKKF